MAWKSLKPHLFVLVVLIKGQVWRRSWNLGLYLRDLFEKSGVCFNRNKILLLLVYVLNFELALPFGSGVWRYAEIFFFFIQENSLVSSFLLLGITVWLAYWFKASSAVWLVGWVGGFDCGRLVWVTVFLNFFLHFLQLVCMVLQGGRAKKNGIRLCEANIVYNSFSDTFRWCLGWFG